ncbi:MAG: squalene/phytoene synthase family protein, partial [Polyangiaceae bacterium]|nr:squalene/phytoene synthase family protein [Polyangiaceae bacterium]
RIRALAVAGLAEHERLRTLVAGVCDLFLDPIRAFMSERDRRGSPEGSGSGSSGAAGTSGPPPAAPTAAGGVAATGAAGAPREAPAVDLRIRAARAAVPGEPEAALGPGDLAFCVRLLPLVSRTFALSIEALPPELRDAVRVSYLLCRVVDSVDDEAALAAAERAALFATFDAALCDDRADYRPFEQACGRLGLGGARPERELCQQAGAVFRAFRALPAAQRDVIRPSVLEMSRGMREYTARADARPGGKLRLRDLGDLERYCYFVAGTVGELLTALFEQTLPGLDDARRRAVRERAVPFGLGLQLVNIVKDVAADFERGDCYLPEELAAAHGLDLERVLEPGERDRALAVLRLLCARARAHLEAAAEYAVLWPASDARAVRMFCAVPLGLALATLHEVEQGEDSLRRGREPKLSRARVVELFAAADRAVASDAELERFFRAADRPGAASVVATALRADAPSPSAADPGERDAGVARPRLRALRPPTPPATPRPRPPNATTVPERLVASTERPASGRSFTMDAPRNETPARAVVERAFSGRVLVTGAAGHLGANLVHRLLADGRQVRVLLRKGSHNAAMDGLDVERVYGDLRESDKMLAAVRGCETVFHAAAKVSTTNASERENRDIWSSNVLGTQRLLRAALTAGVSRVVVTGSLSAVGRDPEDPSRPADETLPHNPFEEHLPYGRTKVLVEHECLKAMADGLDVVVATSCAILGPHDHKPSRIGRTLLDYTHGKLHAYLPGGFEFVAARDIVEGHMLAMRRGRTGQKYTFSTEFCTVDQLMDLFEEVSGRPRPRLRLPAPLMAGIAEVSSFVLDHFFPSVPQRLTPSAVRLLRSERRADTTKARRELGFQPSSVREAVHEAYADFARRGLVPANPRMVARPAVTVPAAAGARAERPAGKRAGAAA